MISRILVTLDGSALAESVLPYARDLATRLRAKLLFLRVVESRTSELMMGEFVAPDALDAAARQTEAEKREAVDYLSRLTREWNGEGIDAEWEVLEGRPATKIIEVARARDIDLIAMSTHGRSGLGKLVFGSVADEVLRECGTPVLLVKNGSDR